MITADPIQPAAPDATVLALADAAPDTTTYKWERRLGQITLAPGQSATVDTFHRCQNGTSPFLARARPKDGITVTFDYYAQIAVWANYSTSTWTFYKSIYCQVL